MKTMRLCKVLGGVLAGGMLLQAGGCDTTTLTSDMIGACVPLIIDFALNALLGGAI
jgi:hypothetical protein